MPQPDASGVLGLGDLPYVNAQAASGAAAFARWEDGEDGAGWVDVSWSRFLRDVTALAKGFIAAGIAPGDRVVLVCSTRYEWPVVAFAVWAVRGVLVPVHSGCSGARLHRILLDCRPARVIVESRRHAGVVAVAGRELPELGRSPVLGERGPGELEQVVRTGAYMDPSAVLLRREETSRSDPAAIVYPVTTAGGELGAVFTHGSLLAAAESAVRAVGPMVEGVAEPDALLGLPLAGTFGHSVLLACVVARVRVGLASRGVRSRLAEVRSFGPRVLVCTPGLLEAVYAAELAQAREEGSDVLHTFTNAVRHAVEFDRDGRGGAWRRFSRRMYEWAFVRVREELGGRVAFAVCAGGELAPRLTHFYGGAGVPVVQAFGVVRAGGAVTFNVGANRRVGTVGRPAPGMEVRLSRQGEVHVRGASVFSGYFRAPEASERAFRQGWLATGVVGSLDDAGFLTVGAAAGGGPGPGRGPATGGVPAVPAAAAAAVDPVAVLEAALVAHPLIAQALVMVRGRPCAGALVMLGRDQVEYWRLVNGRPLSMPLEEVAAEPALHGEVAAAVRAANAKVDAEAAIRVFHVLPEEFGVHSGLVSASGGLRRAEVERAFAEEIDAMYRGAAGPPR
ncbi:long-chain acyl-CoA synthetase [Murinocardiopsis flavida]|uniref:Long-chain acyl-CoA synthetase n=1 Tax=Murinocardiopsis flavida TaxID=645275 RepID=A0A2P8D996_9ACTN|nr:AMP-binding protein [Murinocardiopsis flavida]PSK93767.1 long-chain acyl-CoA synthetase [Murinocardiopsis flavida]